MYIKQHAKEMALQQKAPTSRASKYAAKVHITKMYMA
jgi:hypothetical protein